MDNTTGTKMELLSSRKSGHVARVIFERLPITADIIGHCCANPLCPCKTVSLEFFDANGQFDNRLFNLVINYETWRLESFAALNDDMDYKKLADEFMSQLDDQFKADILSGIESKAQKEHPLRDDIDLSDIPDGSMVYYQEIYRIEPFDELLFKLDGKEYFVLDHYCPKPKCDCKEVVLAFYELNKDTIKDTPILTYKVKLDTGKGTIEDKDAGISPRFAKELYGGLSRTFGGSAISFFKNRYRKIKEWGTTYFADKDTKAKTTTPKIPRNAPCPCGSGKKYKKSCGVM